MIRMMTKMMMMMMVGARVEVICLAHLYPRSKLDDNHHRDDFDEDANDDDLAWQNGWSLW